MTKLESPLIANRVKRQLSALGFKQLDRLISKAAEVKGTHRYDAEFKPIKEQVTKCVMSLVFDHNVTKEQLSELQKSIKVTNGQLQLPTLFI